MKPSRVDLHIEELVLQGFEGVDPATVGEAVRRELARLLLEGGAPAAWGVERQIPRLDGGRIAVAHGTDAVGTQVARAILDGVDGGNAPHG